MVLSLNILILLFYTSEPSLNLPPFNSNYEQVILPNDPISASAVKLLSSKYWRAGTSHLLKFLASSIVLPLNFIDLTLGKLKIGNIPIYKPTILNYSKLSSFEWVKFDISEVLTQFMNICFNCGILRTGNTPIYQLYYRFKVVNWGNSSYKIAGIK